MSQEPVVVGVAWYDSFQWTLLRKVAADPEILHDSFQDWEASAMEALTGIVAEGGTAVRVPVNVAALVSWCRRKHVPNTSSSRAQYVAGLVHRGTGKRL